jgi:Tfp pilus assembly protein PilF
LVKKAWVALGLSALLASCVTVAPPPPDLYLENLPQALVTPLTLEERILLEEAWDLIRQGRTDKAERSLLRLGPASPLYYVGLGYVALIRDDLPAAEENFSQAVKDDPGSLLGRLGLTQVYQKLGDEDKTFNELREVLKLDPLNGWARQEFEALKTRRTDQATSEAREALAAGDREKGKQAYLRALHYSPEAVKIHLALAGLYREEKRLENALVHYKAAAAAAPAEVKILEEYAATLAEAEQYDKSLTIYEKILDLDSGNTQAKQRVEFLKNKLGIFELPSRYSEIPLTSAVTREDLAALLAVKMKDILAETTAQPPIIIDISASWASKFILRVTSVGLLEVYSNHSFQPRRPITRGELAESLFRAIGYLEGRGYRFIRQIPAEKILIADVTAEHSYYRPISEILSYQIMELYADKTFRPDQAVSGPDAIKTIDILLALVR